MSAGKAKIVVVIVVILLIVLGGIAFLNSKEHCYIFNTEIAVNDCLAGFYYPNNITSLTTTPTIITHPITDSELLDIKLDEGEISQPEIDFPQKAPTFTGRLDNNTNVDIKNVVVELNIYKYGDDPEKFEPISSDTITIIDNVQSKKSVRFKEPLFKIRPEELINGFTWTYRIISAELAE